MFQNNKVNLVISIVAAIAIWAYVVVAINPDETRTIKNVQVKLTNVETLEDKGLTIADNENYTVDVVIKGSRSDTTQVTAKDIEATANVFGFPKGENEVRVVVTVPDKVSLQEVKPQFITINVDEYVTVSRPIKIDFNGEFKEGTEPGFVSAIPEEVEVSGAQSIVKNVSYVEANVDSEDVKDSESTIEVKAVPADQKGNPVDGLTLSQDKIAITSTLCYVKTVPLKVPVRGEVSSEYEVTGTKVPDEVTIKGIKSEIDKINKVESRSVNISDITETTEIPLRFNFPDKVELAESSENISMTVEISGISVKDFTFASSEIQLENLRDGYQALINEEQITVTVYGEKSIIDSLKRGDIKLTIDMSGADYSNDTYKGTIKCTIDGQTNDITIKPEAIQVEINEIG